MERVEHHACFGGEQGVYVHRSETLDCEMRFGVYMPPQARRQACPVLYWLSGLTCTEQNFITKAGAQRYAAEHGVILVAPDTSPRGESVPDDDSYDLGQGAGFYVNATQPPWAAHYRMYDYVVSELPALIESEFNATDRRAIAGHSMGGHGALMIALKNPDRYSSASAFSPVVAPVRVPWGRKAFSAYLGEEGSDWESWDTCALVGSANGQVPFLVDQGDADPFLDEQLRPGLLQDACDAAGHPLSLRLRSGYDHSYFFIASFIGEHVAWHARAMTA